MCRGVGLQRDDLERGGWVTPRRERPRELSMNSGIAGVLRDRLPGYLLGICVLPAAEKTLREDEFRTSAERIPLHVPLLQMYGLRPVPRAARQLAPRGQHEQTCRIEGLDTRDAALRRRPVKLAHLQPREADVAATGILVEDECPVERRARLGDA